MFHLCKRNLEFIGLGYDFYNPSINNYGVMTFKLFKCKKCNRLFYKDKHFMEDMFEDMFDRRLLKLQNAGYEPIGILIKK